MSSFESRTSNVAYTYATRMILDSGGSLMTKNDAQSQRTWKPRIVPNHEGTRENNQVAIEMQKFS